MQQIIKRKARDVQFMSISFLIGKITFQYLQKIFLQTLHRTHVRDIIIKTYVRESGGWP